MKIFATFGQILLALTGVFMVIEGFDTSDSPYMLIGAGLIIVSTITLVALFDE